MKRIEIIGHIGQDAEVKDLGSNQVINFSVAVSESYIKNNEKQTVTTWFECAKWGNNTQIAQYLKKGQQVYISGTPTARSWQKETGELISVLGINVFNLELLGGKKDSNEQSNQSSPQPQPQPQSNSLEPTSNIDEHNDLPF